jgi:hypothetical protein
LTLQIRNLLFGIGNLPFAFGYLTAEFFILSQQPFIFSVQLFTARRVGVPMAIRLSSFLPRLARRFRTHPQYGKRLVEICPAKSSGVPELLPGIFMRSS